MLTITVEEHALSPSHLVLSKGAQFLLPLFSWNWESCGCLEDMVVLQGMQHPRKTALSLHWNWGNQGFISRKGDLAGTAEMPLSGSAGEGMKPSRQKLQLEAELVTVMPIVLNGNYPLRRDTLSAASDPLWNLHLNYPEPRSYHSTDTSNIK